MAYTVSSGSQGVIISEVVLNDSDKLLVPTTTLGSTRVFRPSFIYINFAATATVGTRTLRVVHVRDGVTVHDNLLNAGVAITAGLTVGVTLTPEVGDAGFVAVGTGFYQAWMPELVLTAEDTLRIYDSAAVDAAADDMLIHIHGTLL